MMGGGLWPVGSKINPPSALTTLVDGGSIVEAVIP